MKDNLWEHMYGTDASKEISLLEYGLLVAPGEVVNPEQCAPSGEYFCVYRIGEDAFGTGYIKEQELNALIDGKDWASAEDIASFLCWTDADGWTWKDRSFEHKLSDVLQYWGYENIMGSGWAGSGMTQDEAMERYLGPEYALGECDILCDESRGIYIPQAFAEMYGDRIVNEKGQDRTEDPELDDTLMILGRGPGENNEGYWDAMIEIEQNYLYKDSTGKLWDIEQNGDLWAYEHGKRRPEGHDGE